MRSAWFALAITQALLVAGCAEVIKGFPGPGNGNPPVEHLPNKADLFQCSASYCDQIPVNIQVVNGECTVPFLYQRVRIEPGVTARFAFAVLTPEFIYRFTDPSSTAVTTDPARNLPAVDIDYRGMKPAFAVGYAGSSPAGTNIQARDSAGNEPVRASRAVQDLDVAKYDVVALRDGANPAIYYRFTIHAEWSQDHGATWLACKEKDPVIANN